mmetsp:Transcript_110451/g.293407  ORF Transcript_110451/g.293407 Transcript_110451/m.293407 type:complete len:236 (+) Transcript_110451:402-1109(+)
MAQMKSMTSAFVRFAIIPNMGWTCCTTVMLEGRSFRKDLVFTTMSASILMRLLVCTPMNFSTAASASSLLPAFSASAASLLVSVMMFAEVLRRPAVIRWRFAYISATMVSFLKMLSTSMPQVMSSSMDQLPMLAVPPIPSMPGTELGSIGSCWATSRRRAGTFRLKSLSTEGALGVRANSRLASTLWDCTKQFSSSTGAAAVAAHARPMARQVRLIAMSAGVKAGGPRGLGRWVL